MRLTTLIEGVLLLVLGLVAMAGGLRLVIYKDPRVLYDPLGPGLYITAISVGLMTIGVVYLVRSYRKPPTMNDVPVDKKMRIRMMSTVAACIIYIFLIRIVGYLLATIIFFFLEFRIEGIKSWPLVVVLSLVLSAFYYFIFVQCCSMVFPRGIFFR
jgi:small-conductance mechanosensitive channel